MTDPVHIVCPHCDAINRVGSERLKDQPVCGKCTRELFMAKPVDVTSARFARHIERNGIPVLVDFWAAWCGPCKAMGPAYHKAAATLEPQMRLLKVDTEAVQDVAARLNIRSIPTLALFHHGREVARQAGAMDAGNIVAWVHSHLGAHRPTT